MLSFDFFWSTHQKFLMVSTSIPPGYCNKVPYTGRPLYHTCISHSSGKPQIKMTAELVPGESRFLVHKPSFSCVLTQREGQGSSLSPLEKDIKPIYGGRADQFPKAPLWKLGFIQEVNWWGWGMEANFQTTVASYDQCYLLGVSERNTINPSVKYWRYPGQREDQIVGHSDCHFLTAKVPRCNIIYW